MGCEYLVWLLDRFSHCISGYLLLLWELYFIFGRPISRLKVKRLLKRLCFYFRNYNRGCFNFRSFAMAALMDTNSETYLFCMLNIFAIEPHTVHPDKFSFFSESNISPNHPKYRRYDLLTCLIKRMIGKFEKNLNGILMTYTSPCSIVVQRLTHRPWDAG